MNKEDVVKQIAANVGITDVLATRMVDAFVNAVRSGLQRDSRVHIRGLGVFTLQPKAERLVPNPTGKPGRWSKPSTTTRFRPSEHFDRASVKPASKGKSKPRPEYLPVSTDIAQINQGR